MGISVKRQNYTDHRRMVFDIHQDMLDAGYTLLFYRDTLEIRGDNMIVSPISYRENPDPSKVGLYVFQSSQIVDPYPVTEPYNIVFMVHDKWWKVFVCTPENLKFAPETDSFYIEEYPQEYWPEPIAENFNEFRDRRSVGVLSRDNIDADDSKGRQFLNLDPDLTLWPSIEDIPIDPNLNIIELEPNPLSYRLTVTHHGIVLCIWLENMNDKPDCQAWFCVQRPKNRSGTFESTSKHPIWCVYSQNGGGNPEDTSLNFPEMDIDGIRQFVVREADISLPTLSCSAVFPKGEHAPIINPMEQVSLRESGQHSVIVPTGMNTWRFKYPHLLDLIGFSSADCSAHGHYVGEDIFNDSNVVTYAAMKANRPENRGMRFFMQSSGPGTEPGGVYNLHTYMRHTNRGASDSMNTPIPFVELDLIDDLTGQPYPAPYEIKIPFTVMPESTAVEGLDYNLQPNGGYIVIPTGSTKGKLFGEVLPRAGDNGIRTIEMDVTDNLSEPHKTTRARFTISN